MYNVVVLLTEIHATLSDLFNKLLFAVHPPGNDQCPGSFYATKFCETKCIHNYLYYITSSGVHDESSLLIQPKIPKDMLVWVQNAYIPCKFNIADVAINDIKHTFS